MKKVEAIVRVSALEQVKSALEAEGIMGITVEQVRGYGRQFGRTDKYRGSTYAVNMLPKVRVMIVLKAEQVDTAIEAITRAAQTGEIGDGKIFVSDVLDAVRIRTGERGEDALS